MAKRGPGSELNKDNWESVVDAEGESQESLGTWQKADDATLAGRKIRKVKRPAKAAAAPEGGGGGAAPAASSNPFASVQLVAGVRHANSATGRPCFRATQVRARMLGRLLRKLLALS